MPTQILPAASLRSTNRLPAAQLLVRASNYLMCWALWSIGWAIFGIASKFHPALREDELSGSVEQLDDGIRRRHRRTGGSSRADQQSTSCGGILLPECRCRVV